MTASPTVYSWQWWRRHVSRQHWPFSSVLVLTPNSLPSLFYIFWQIFNLENKTLQMHPSSLANAGNGKPHGGAPPHLVVCSQPSLLELKRKAFNIWLYQLGPPPSLEANLPPSHYLGPGRRPEKAVHGVTIHPVGREARYKNLKLLALYSCLCL
jgi:hypothetical protein